MYNRMGCDADLFASERLSVRREKGVRDEFMIGWYLEQACGVL